MRRRGRTPHCGSLPRCMRVFSRSTKSSELRCPLRPLAVPLCHGGATCVLICQSMRHPAPDTVCPSPSRSLLPRSIAGRKADLQRAAELMSEHYHEKMLQRTASQASASAGGLAPSAVANAVLPPPPPQQTKERQQATSRKNRARAAMVGRSRSPSPRRSAQIGQTTGGAQPAQRRRDARSRSPVRRTDSRRTKQPATARVDFGEDDTIVVHHDDLRAGSAPSHHGGMWPTNTATAQQPPAMVRVVSRKKNKVGKEEILAPEAQQQLQRVEAELGDLRSARALRSKSQRRTASRRTKQPRRRGRSPGL